jgi:NifU-like protein
VQKRQIIEAVIEKEVAPYVALDAGGVQVEYFSEKEVGIRFHGACEACPSSLGSTLDAIQRILQTRVHPSLIVVPQMF